LPLTESSFAVQRELAELVASCTSNAPAQTPAGDDASDARAPTTQPILPQPPMETGSGFTLRDAGARASHPGKGRRGRIRARMGWAFAAALGAAAWVGVRSQETDRAPIPAAPASTKPAANVATRVPPVESTRPPQALHASSAEDAANGVDAAVPPAREARGSPFPARVAAPPRAALPAAAAAVEAPPSPEAPSSATVKGRSGIALHTDEF
jgi:hypothetical protein